MYGAAVVTGAVLAQAEKFPRATASIYMGIASVLTRERRQLHGMNRGIHEQ